MKLLIFLFLLPNVAISQNPFNLPIDSVSGKIFFNETKQTSSTKDKLYTTAKLMLADEIAASNAQILMDDKESGIVVFTSKYEYVDTTNATMILKERVSFTVKLIVSNNQYTISISNFMSTFSIDGYKQQTPIENRFLFDPESSEGKKYYTIRAGMKDRFTSQVQKVITAIESRLSF